MAKGENLNDPMYRLGIARYKAKTAMPYLATGLYRLRFVPDPGTATLAVDKQWRCFFNPERVVTTWTPGELGWILLHEVWHLLRGHHSRGDALKIQDEEVVYFKISADLPINTEMPESFETGEDPVRMPANLVLPEQFKKDDGTVFPRGLTFEQYFKLFRENKKSNPPPKVVYVGNGGCGSCSGGDKDEDQARIHRIKDMPEGMGPVEEAAVRRDVAQGILKRSKEGGGRGTVPSEFQRWAEEVCSPPKIPWQTVTRGAIRRAAAEVMGQADFTYSKPSRRDNSQFIMPALRSPKLRIAMVIDTSGSVNAKGLGLAGNEVKGAIKRTQAQVFAIGVDAQAAAPIEIHRPLDFKRALKGGGGTDMRVGIEAAMKLKPQIIVVLTDLMTPWPETPIPGVKLIVVGILSSAHDKAAVPAWARLISVDDDAIKEDDATAA